MPVAFGPLAVLAASRLPAGLEAVVCDGTDVAEAYAAVVKRRRAGIPVYAMPLLVDARAGLARTFSFSVLSKLSDPDQIRVAFENIAAGTLAVNGLALSQMGIYQSDALNTVREVVQVADALLVRSETERRAIETLLQTTKAFTAVAPLADPTLPGVAPDPDADRIVVWAPDLSCEEIALYAYALSALHRPPLIVCRGGIGGINAEFAPPERGAEALRRAAVVLDTKLGDPGTAIALAQRGFLVVAAKTTGAHEFIDGLITYDPANFATVLAAVSRARAAQALTVRLPTDVIPRLDVTLAASQPRIMSDGPRVSVIVPTYNRRAVLPRCLQLLARQTYPNLEIIIVNDGGESVADIVGDFPGVTLIDMPKNGGAVAAVTLGIERASGEYIVLLADDDVFYPNHVAALAQAAVASNADVLHTNRIVRLVNAREDGTEATFGHRLTHFGSLDPIEAFWACNISQQAMMVRRKLFASLELLSNRWQVTGDYEFVIHLSKVTDFVHVDITSAEMVVRDDRSSHGLRDGEATTRELGEMLAFHLPPGRALIADRQRVTVEGQLQNHQESATFFRAFSHLKEPVVEVL